MGAVVRTWHIGSQSLWFDEARFLEAALRPDFKSVVQFMIEEDYHPPLYPLVLKGWVAVFGTSDAAVRALPALAGLSLVPLTAWLTMLLARDRRASIVAASFVSLGGYHLYLSQEARHYTWLAAFGILNIIAFVQVLRYSRKRWLATLGLTALVGSLSHYYMLLVTVGQIVFAARARVRLRGTVLAVLAASVIGFVLLWAGPFVAQGRQRAAWGGGFIDPLAGPGQALYFVAQSVYWTAVDFSFGRPILLVGAVGLDWLDAFKFSALAAGVVTGMSGLLALRRQRSRYPFSTLGLVAAVGGAPVALAIASSLTEAMIYDTKYVSFAAPLWAAAIGVGLGRLLRKPTGILLAALLGAALLAAGWAYHVEAIPWKEDWRGAARVVDRHWRDGDILLQRSPYTAFCLNHYLGWSPPRLTGRGTYLLPELAADPIANEVTEAGASRLWVVISHDEHGATLLEVLGARLQETGRWLPNGVTVVLYSVPSGTGVP